MRSNWKPVFCAPTLVRLLRASVINKNKLKVHKIYSRSSTILAEFVNWTFNVYNGKSYQLLRISEEMVGHKFGEFVFTKRKTASIHNKKSSKTKSKSKKK